MLNIAVSGCSGKMGRVIYDVINNRDDCRVCCGIDITGAKYADFPVYTKIDEMKEKPDIFIDYSHPSLLNDLLEYCLSTGTPIIFATTGYNDSQISQIHKASEQIPVFFTFNLSMGINLLAELAKKATQILGGQFDIEIVEKHHNQKIDAPSGTAIMLANAINEELNNSYTYVYDRHSVRQKRGKTEIGLHAVRGRDEVITLSHSATSKEVFAVGSVNAAVYMANKPAGLYNMKDLI